MKLGLVYGYKNTACWGKKLLCKLQAPCHKTKPFITGKIVFVGKVITGVVGRVYVNEVYFIPVVWQKFLKGGIVVGGDENVACCGG